MSRDTKWDSKVDNIWNSSTINDALSPLVPSLLPLLFLLLLLLLLLLLKDHTPDRQLTPGQVLE